MKILDKYLIKQLIATTLVVMFGLLAVDLFLYFVNEIRYVGRGDYKLGTALTYIALKIPTKVYTLFPWSALLGGLLAMGTLAKSSELVAMQTLAMSVYRIGWGVIKGAVILTVCMFIFGEIVSPYTEQLAQRTKTTAMSRGQAIQTQYGTWIRNENAFIHVQEIINNNKLIGVTSYRLDGNLKVIEVITAKLAYLDGDSWVLEDVVGTRFLGDHTQAIQHDKHYEKDFIDMKIIETSGVKYLDRLSLVSLHKAIKTRLGNDLNAKDYQLAFWKKIFQPLAAIVMVYLAIPFIFGPLRSASLGLKIIVGVLVGFAFHALNTIFAPLITVINVPPLAATLTPIAVFFILGTYLIRQVR